MYVPIHFAIRSIGCKGDLSRRMHEYWLAPEQRALHPRRHAQSHVTCHVSCVTFHVSRFALALSMKLGIYLQTWHVGGIAAFCERLAQGLVASGHRTCIVLSTPYGKRDLDGRRAYEQLLKNNLCPVICLHLNAHHPKERSWRAADSISALRCDALILSAHRPLVDTWTRLSGQTALIGVAHTDDEDTYGEFAACRSCCDAYVAVSSTILANLKRLSPSGLLRQIPCGVPLPVSQEPSPDSPNGRVLVVCRLEQTQKRVLDLPQVWAEYRRRKGAATLTICGSGPDEARLRQAFAEEVAQRNVSLLGAVPLAQMPALYARHDILLSVAAYEGMPTAVLEAVTHGLFPILSDIRSGHRDIVETIGRGKLCPPGDTAAFARTLLECTRDVDYVRQQRSLIRMAAGSQYSLERMTTDYLQLLAEVRQRRASGLAPATRAVFGRPKADPLRRFIRYWQYSRHYGNPNQS